MDPCGWKVRAFPSQDFLSLAQLTRPKMESAAQIIAIGPFSQKVLDGLEYPASDYAKVPEGSTVVTNVFVALNPEESFDLAVAFGVGAMDLGRHELDPRAANLQVLDEVFRDETVRGFLLLRESGFRFYFLPNA